MAENDIYLVRQKTDGTFEELKESPLSYIGLTGDSDDSGNELLIKSKLRVPELTVEGTTTIVDENVTTSEQLLITNDGTGPAVVINQKGAEGVLDVQDDGGSALYVRGDAPYGGFIGLGTTTPTKQLELTGDILLANNKAIYLNDVTAGTPVAKKSFYQDSSEILTLSNAGGDGVSIKTGATSEFLAVRIDKDGLVGMGSEVSDPQAHLDIVRDGQSNIKLRHKSNSAIGEIDIDVSQTVNDVPGIMRIGTTTNHALALGVNNVNFLTLSQTGGLTLEKKEVNGVMSTANLTIEGELSLPNATAFKVAGEELLWTDEFSVSGAGAAESFKFLEFSYGTHNWGEGSPFIVEIWSEYYSATGYQKYLVCHTHLDTDTVGTDGNPDLSGGRDYQLKILESTANPQSVNSAKFRLRMGTPEDTGLNDGDGYDIATVAVHAELKHYAKTRIKVTSLASNSSTHIGANDDWTSEGDEYKFYTAPIGVDITNDWDDYDFDPTSKDAVYAEAFYGSRMVNDIGADKDPTGYFLKPADTGTSMAVAGNVGIGVDSPAAKLHVNGPADVAMYITSENNWDDEDPSTQPDSSTAIWFAHGWANRWRSITNHEDTLTDEEYNTYSATEAGANQWGYWQGSFELIPDPNPTPDWAGIIFDADNKLRITNSGSSNGQGLVISEEGDAGIGRDPFSAILHDGVVTGFKLIVGQAIDKMTLPNSTSNWSRGAISITDDGAPHPDVATADNPGGSWYGGIHSIALNFGLNNLNSNGDYSEADLAGWIQATNPANNSESYPLLLNPNGGNVGIGTASPQYPLHVTGDAHIDGGILTMYSVLGGGAQSGWIGFGSTTENNNQWRDIQIGNLYEGIQFCTFPDGSTADQQVSMRITKAGNVGIGTDSPDQPLSVKGDAIIGQDITTGVTILSVGSSTSADKRVILSYDNDNNKARLSIAGDASPAGITIDDGGNVGIGTTSPSKKLDVAGDISVNGRPITNFDPSSHFYLGNQDWTSLSNYAEAAANASTLGQLGPGLAYDEGEPLSQDPPGGMVMTRNAAGNYNVKIKCRTPIDPKATYSVAIRVRKLVDGLDANGNTFTSDDLFYAGVDSLDENFDHMQDDNASTYNYGVASDKTLREADGAVTYTGLFSGYNDTSGANHNKFDPEAKFFNVVLLCNYMTFAGNGTLTNEPATLIESVEIRRVVEDGMLGAGKVGIGTTSPDSLLHLESSNPEIRFRDNDYDGVTTHYSSIGGNGGSGVLELSADANNQATNSAITMLVDNAERMRIDSDGNVGIGTDANGNQAVTLQPGVATNSYSKVFASSYLNLSLGSGAGNQPRIYLRGSGNGETDAGDIYMASADAANSLVIQGTTGNVGIGTSQPSARLSVLSSAPGTNSAIIENDHIEGYGLKTIGGGNTTTRYLADFRDKDGVSGLKIDGDRNVNIGGNLDIGGNLSISGTTTTINTATLDVEDLNITVAKGATSNAAANGAGLTVDGAGATLLYNSTPDAWSFNKNVGIGTDSPDTSLDIHGFGIHIHNDDHAELGFGNSAHGEWMRLQFDGGADRNLNFTRFVSTSEANSGAPYPATGGWFDQLFLERSTGNVGIGTDNPQAPLDVIGPDGPVTTANDGIVIRAAATNDWLTMGTDSANRTSWIRPVRSGTGNNKLQLDATSVGIGTNQPDHKLHIEGSDFTSSSLKLYRTSTTPAPNNDAGIILQADAGGNNDFGLGAIYFKTTEDDNVYAKIRAKTDDGTGTSGRLEFTASAATISNSTAPSMTIKSTGKVEIGPHHAKLEVNSDITTGDLVKIDIAPATAGTNPAGLHITNSNANLASGAAYLKITDQGGNHKLRVNQDGKVGIGTDNPTHSLTIGDGTSNEWIKIYGEEGHFSVGTGSISNGKKYFSLYDSESNNHRLTISEEGKVGIGEGLSTSGGTSAIATAQLDVSTGVNGMPNTDISEDTEAIALRLCGGDNAVIDFGVNGGTATWIQARNKVSNSLEYPLSLNPNGGNVGIGTAAPTSNLDTVGTIRAIKGTQIPPTSGFGMEMFHDDNRGYIFAYDRDNGVYGPCRLGNSLYVLANGNVGIGEATPETPLHITSPNKLGSSFTGTTRGEGVLVEQTNYTPGNYLSLIESSYDNSRTSPNVRIAAKFSGSGSYLAFGTSHSYGAGVTNEAMVIDPTGRVEIGGEEVLTSPAKYEYEDGDSMFNIDSENFLINTDIAGVIIDGTYELYAKINPNEDGSPQQYSDFIYGKIIISTSGTTGDRRRYANYVRENPQPRDLDGSGTLLNHDITAVLVTGASPFTEQPNGVSAGSSSRLRLSFNSDAHTKAGSNIGWFNMKIRKII